MIGTNSVPKTAGTAGHTDFGFWILDLNGSEKNCRDSGTGITFLLQLFNAAVVNNRVEYSFGRDFRSLSCNERLDNSGNNRRRLKSGLKF